MSAIYRVHFDDGHSLYVDSADAKSLKAKDMRSAYIKARKKAEAKLRKIEPKTTAKAVSVNCVG